MPERHHFINGHLRCRLEWGWPEAGVEQIRQLVFQKGDAGRRDIVGDFGAQGDGRVTTDNNLSINTDCPSMLHTMRAADVSKSDEGVPSQLRARFDAAKDAVRSRSRPALAWRSMLLCRAAADAIATQAEA